MRTLVPCLATIAAVAALAFAPPVVSIAEPEPATTPTRSARAALEEHRRFADAMDAYRNGHWPAAYAGFKTLADRGHPYAARMALLMIQDGPSRHGVQWDASEKQQENWLVTESSLLPLPGEAPATLQAARGPGE